MNPVSPDHSQMAEIVSGGAQENAIMMPTSLNMIAMAVDQ
jgi:hypothetical protein